MPIDTTKDYIIVKSTRDHHEVGSIPYRRKWHRDGSGSVVVIKGRKSVKKSGVLHAERKVIIRMSVQPLNIIWLQEPQIPWPQEEGYGVRYAE
jgi:hypothetical protein